MTEAYDARLEALIDKAGRDEVFARARELGWAGMGPPKWVWQEIAAKILQERRQDD